MPFWIHVWLFMRSNLSNKIPGTTDHLGPLFDGFHRFHSWHLEEFTQKGHVLSLWLKVTWLWWNRYGLWVADVHLPESTTQPDAPHSSQNVAKETCIALLDMGMAPCQVTSYAFFKTVHKILQSTVVLFGITKTMGSQDVWNEFGSGGILLWPYPFLLFGTELMSIQLILQRGNYHPA